ncbi:MAG: 50S ribosomal protein L15 [Gemmatimonadota bacterium]|nr:50S ribosomal protein L15 [Gemmatimonadota bacterium]
MKEHELKPPAGSQQERTRKGRGDGSNRGTYCGRGVKGQTARSGGKVPAWFEGGQMPLQRRVPKRGFNNTRFRVENQIVNLEQLEARDEVTEFTVERLAELGLVELDRGPIKVLGKGEITRAITVEADAASAGAREAIEAAGGTVRLRGEEAEGGSES